MTPMTPGLTETWTTAPTTFSDEERERLVEEFRAYLEDATRPPEPDDLICPSQKGDHRNPRRALIFFHADCETLGFRKRRQHDACRTFTSLARADSARPDIIDWVTHGPGSTILDIYTTLPWDSLCHEVSKMRLELRGVRVPTITEPRGLTMPPCDNPCDSQNAGKKKPPSFMSLEALSSARSRGLEPLTSGVTGRRSNQLN